MTQIETVTIKKILPTKIWIENDMTGSRHVVLQHEGCDPFTYCSFNYDYRYTSNAGTYSEAVAMAKALGAIEPIEQRHRQMHWPTIPELKDEIAGLQQLLHDEEERAKERESMQGDKQ